MCAELLHGTQTERNDRLIFDRKAQLTSSDGMFNGKLKVMLWPGLTETYVDTLEHSRSDVQMSSVKAAIVGGKLDLRFEVTASDRRRWAKARTGNQYRTINIWLEIGSDPDCLKIHVPSGAHALISANLIFLKRGF